MKFLKKLLLLFLPLFMLVGCPKPFQKPEPTEDPFVLATPEPTQDFTLTTPEPTVVPTPHVEETPVPTPTPKPVATATPAPTPKPTATPEPTEEAAIDEEGIYDTKDEVALYLWTYHHLPSNYMTKKEARKYGWEGGALNRVVKGKCIGGDVYGNYEGILPKIKGKYYECDIDTINKKSRGGKRIVYDENFNIYYTGDHYETFEQLYGD